MQATMRRTRRRNFKNMKLMSLRVSTSTNHPLAALHALAHHAEQQQQQAQQQRLPV
jgi:hypothetical protein